MVFFMKNIEIVKLESKNSLPPVLLGTPIRKRDVVGILGPGGLDQCFGSLGRVAAWQSAWSSVQVVYLMIQWLT